MWGLAGLVLAATVAGIAHKVVSSRPPPRPLVPALSEEDRARKRVRDLYQFAQERAELNSDELQIHLDTFHAVKKEAEAIGYVEVARMAAERIAYYQDRRDREVNRVIVLLRNSAEELAAEGNLVGAQTLLLSYEGPYRRESEARRIELWKTLEATVQERLRHEDEVMLKNTRARVETLLKEKKIEDASKVVASLRQSGRPESRLEREYLAVELGKAVEAARQEYETEQEKMRAEQRSRLASLADLLLSGNLQAAGYVAQAAEAGPLREQMIADVRRIARTGSIILGSFTRDIGKDVDLWLVEGPRTYRILEVRETEIVAARAGSDGRVTVSLGLADMTSGEKVRRLVAMLGEPDAAIPCGMLAWAARNPVAAAGYFEKAGTPLGRELATRALAGMQEKNTGDSASTAKENP